jgi:uncharacterized membrane protein YhiD involved in acid resistance
VEDGHPRVTVLFLQDPITQARGLAEWLGTASVATVMAFFLFMVCWYFVRKEKELVKSCNKEKADIRSDAQTIIDEKTRVIGDLANRLNTATEESQKRMDKFVQMMADGAHRTEQVLTDNAVKMATLQQSIQDLRHEVRALGGRGGS